MADEVHKAGPKGANAHITTLRLFQQMSAGYRAGYGHVHPDFPSAIARPP